MLTEFLGKLFYLLNHIIPKAQNKTVFCSFPDLEDMLRGLLPHLNGRVIVLVKTPNVVRPSWLPVEVELVKKLSLVGISHLLTARYIYYTHGLLSFFRIISSKKQLVVNLWHGMALKNIGLLDGKSNPPQCHKTICTSKFFQKIHAKAFGMKQEDVLITGLPRNDILTKQTTNAKLLTIKENYSNCYVWLPTYRKSEEGDIRVDGDTSNIFCFESFDYFKLNKILSEKNELLIIKPHPMAVLDVFEEELSNIKIINEHWLTNNDTTLYELLSISDALWTDYSSVFVDYLVTNKPILFIVPDLDAYKNSRGFTFDITDIELPGYVIVNENELFNLVVNSDYMNNYRIKKQFFNSVKEYKHHLVVNHNH